MNQLQSMSKFMATWTSQMLLCSNQRFITIMNWFNCYDYAKCYCRWNCFCNNFSNTSSKILPLGLMIFLYYICYQPVDVEINHVFLLTRYKITQG